MQLRNTIIGFVGVVAISGAGTDAAEIHVHEGESIQAAINAAAPGDEVVVHPGTYTENLNLSGKAITLRATDPVDPGVVTTTILDGGAVGTVITCNADETAATVISGFTITNGSAANGGGMFISLAGPTLLHCTFRENVADYGGGIFNSSGTPVLVECTLEQNTASSSGGGMYNFGHPGQPGATLTNCEFNENTAQSNGGAMRNWDSSPTLTGCTFYSNHVRVNGAGMANGGASHPVATGCRFLSNRADTLFANWDSHGGGMHNSEDARPTLVNCVFQANSAHAMLPWLSHGGAIANVGEAGPLIVNCTLIANHANLGDGLFNRDTAGGAITNSILWDGEDEIVNEDSGWADIRYSDVQGSWPGPGNISADPLLQGLMPLPGSPCIDAGHNWGVPTDGTDVDQDGDTAELLPVDLEGNPRFADDPATDDTGCGAPAVVDMGAYEFQGKPYDVKLGDIDGDGVVDVNDFLLLLAGWGGCVEDCCLPDLDLNGDVGVSDFLLLLANWG